MGVALVIAFIGGLCLLIPSLILVFRLFLFDADYVKGKNKSKRCETIYRGRHEGGASS